MTEPTQISDDTTPAHQTSRVAPDPPPETVGAPDDDTLATMAKAIGHPARVAILRLLAHRDTCVTGDLVAELPLAQSTSPSTSGSCAKPDSSKARSKAPAPATALTSTQQSTLVSPQRSTAERHPISSTPTSFRALGDGIQGEGRVGVHAVARVLAFVNQSPGWSSRAVICASVRSSRCWLTIQRWPEGSWSLPSRFP